MEASKPSISADGSRHSSLTPLRVFRGVLCLLVLLSTAFMMLVYFGFLSAVALRFFSIHYSRKTTSFFFAMWLALWPFLFEKINKTKVIFSGETVPARERVLLIANHRTEVDWMYLWDLALRKGRLGYIKYVLKSSLMKLPVFGWSFQVLEFISVERKWEVDEPTMHRMLSSFKDIRDPLWLALFPEGTDFTEQKCLRSKKYAAENGLPILTHVLLPKTKGFYACLEELRTTIDAVYDVTIGYKHRCPSFLDNVFGVDPSEVHIHIRRIKLDDIPASEDEVSSWLMDIFSLKDKFLSDFQSQGHFPNEGTEGELSTLKCLFNALGVIFLTGTYGKPDEWETKECEDLQLAVSSGRGCDTRLKKMLSRWWLSGELRNSMSGVAFTGKKTLAYLLSRGFVNYGHSGLPCTSFSSPYQSASSCFPPRISIYSILSKTFSTSSSQSGPAAGVVDSPNLFSNNCSREGDPVTFGEAKKLMRLVNVEELKKKLGMEEREVIGYKELLEACESTGVAKSPHEAAAFAQVLDEAGFVLLFRDKVYLHPDKIVDLVRRAVPLALTPEDDPMREELKRLQETKEEIDVLAHKQVRRILWSGLGFALIQIGLFFRLTFWEFSWDVMEPISFFATTTSIVIGYSYFLFTSRDPTYRDFMNRLFLSRQRKLLKRQNFDVDRFVELQRKCKSPLDANSSLKKRVGVDLDLEDALHKH